MAGRGRFQVVAVGGSAGGMDALVEILEPLSPSFPAPVLVVQHLHKTDGGRFAEHLARRAPLPVEEASDKLPIEAGRVYVAPANYHLLLETSGTLALSVDAKVNWARPSIDVLFESAARAYGDAVIGIILSGANDDGAAGMKCIVDHGGVGIAQDPATAQVAVMPHAAVELAALELVLAPRDIGARLLQLCSEREAR